MRPYCIENLSFFWKARKQFQKVCKKLQNLDVIGGVELQENTTYNVFYIDK